MRLVTVIGARPQFIKAALISQRFLRRGSVIDETLVHTGQHYDDAMSGNFFSELAIPNPSYNLGIGSGSHAAMTGGMLEAIEIVLVERRPDWVLCYGDTNSTLAGGLAAAKLAIPVAHVEAGLRSYNRRMPEEINRVLTDHLSSILFAPTSQAVSNLAKEGMIGESVHLVGDIMYDVAMHVSSSIGEQSATTLRSLHLKNDEFIVATIHRAENTDDNDRLRACFDGLLNVAKSIQVVVPLHPRTRTALAANGLLEQVLSGLKVIPPTGYRDMVVLETSACLVVTDSGGVQKEAYFHRTPCVTLRDETEWIELVDAGWNHLVPPHSAADVANGIARVLGMAIPADTPSFYGKGDTAENVYQILAAQ